MDIRTLHDADMTHKVVMTRLDLNVPVNDKREVTDTTRITRSVPTLRHILDAGGKPVIMSHFGRPKGKMVAGMSMRFLTQTLERHLNTRVQFADDSIGGAAQRAIAAAQPGEVVLLENTRFHPGEEKNDPDYARQLADLGDIFVPDAFSCAHRAHASTEGVAAYLPSYAGVAMAAEIQALQAALATPKRPVLAVVGGAKISTKLPVLRHLVTKVDGLIIGGGMANTFLLQRGVQIGNSLAEPGMIGLVAHIQDAAIQSGCRIILPIDVRCARAFQAGADYRDVSVDAVADDEMILDAGPKTVALLQQEFDQAATVLWNGPLGAFEIPPFDHATKAAAQYVAKRTNEKKLTSVAGGGDTVAALAAADADEAFSYVSTAGGAFLEWLEGKTLPGVAILYQS